MVYKSLNGLAPSFLKSMFTDGSAISTYSLRNCEGKTSCFTSPHQFSKNTVSAIVSRCRGTAYLPICGKHKLLLVLNTPVGVSFLLMINSPFIHGEKLSRVEGSPAYLSYPGRANFSYISLQNLANRSHEKQKVGSARRVTRLAG